MSLHSIDNKKTGVVLAYNQHEFEEWSENVDGPNRAVHFSIDRKLSDIARLSFLPCFSYKSTGPGFIEAKISPSCHFRYTEILNFRGTDLGFFHREGGGIVYNAIEPDIFSANVLTGQLHLGGGIFYDFWMNESIYIRPFLGLFLRGDTNWENSEGSDKTDFYLGGDLSGEFGVELKVWGDQSIFGTWTTSLIDLDPKFYIGTRFY